MSYCSSGTNNKSWKLVAGTYKIRFTSRSSITANYSLTTYSEKSLNTIEVKGIE